jgi:hypothetical protein
MFGGRPLVTVFCGSRTGVSSRYSEEAAAVGRALAAAGAGLLYGGGRVGLMGALADAALEAGAPVWGVIPAGLARKELAHRGLTRLDVVATMHERKALMGEAATGFVALAGGFGTLDELFEVITWKQLGHHDRPIAILNGTGYWDALLSAVERMAVEGFLHESEELYRVASSPEEAVRHALARGGG